MPTLHREGGHLLLCRVEVWIVVAGAGVARSLFDVCSNERLVLKLETHAECRTTSALLNVVIIGPWVLVTASEVAPD